ncbi:hypothetical protein BV210_16880 [Halorientalis sp. IM1011]|uniref:LEA type 2 family protein n=1 Tax=Halorientalis sp. IM1011 TaxID=1932360 RepID=UPI00097CC407|nr:LEA type 2 family protein [Halorientalis sp. IM1011]AQL44286.1 hypothetical protein BV210_16880 [Halorientalis sp. IM1011]
MFDTDRDGTGLGTAGTVLLVVAVLLVIGVSVVVAGFTTDLLGVPEVTAVDNEFAGVTESITVVDSGVTVRNPNPVTVAVDSVDLRHTVFANGVRMGWGSREAVSLPVGNSTVEIGTDLRNDRFTDWWMRHVERGERTNLTVVASVTSATFDTLYSRTVLTRTVRTDALAAVETDRRIPVEADTALVSGPVLYVERTRARWASVSQNRTVVAVNATLSNPTAFEIPLQSVGFDVAMNDVAIANGSTVDATTIPAGSTANLTVRVVVDNGKLDAWWPTHLERNQTTRVRIDPRVRVDLSRYGRGTRTVTPAPINRTVETDFFADEGTFGAV